MCHAMVFSNGEPLLNTLGPYFADAVSHQGIRLKTFAFDELELFSMRGNHSNEIRTHGMQ